MYNTHFIKYIQFGILISLLITSCAGPFRSNKPLPQMNQETLIDHLENHASQLITFQGRARLTVISPEGSFQGSIKISAKLPDSLWIKIEGPLGIDLVTGRFNREQALMYVPLENIAYVGFIEEIEEMALLPFDINVPDIILGVLGLFIPPDGWNENLISISSDNNNYILRFADREQVWIEPKGPVVSRWEQRNGDNDILWSWEGRDFKNNKGLRLPQIIKMTSYDPKQRVTLFYEDVKTNRSMESNWAEIVIPEGVQYVRL